MNINTYYVVDIIVTLLQKKDVVKFLMKWSPIFYIMQC